MDFGGTIQGTAFWSLTAGVVLRAISVMPRRAQTNGTSGPNPLLLLLLQHKPATTTIRELLADPILGPYIPDLSLQDLGGKAAGPSAGANGVHLLTDGSLVRRGSSRRCWPHRRRGERMHTDGPDGSDGIAARDGASLQGLN